MANSQVDGGFATLDVEQLSTVAGGGWLGDAGRLLGRAAGKLAVPVSMVMDAIDTVDDAKQGYQNGRKRGESRLRAAGSGALNAVTMGISEAVRRN